LLWLCMRLPLPGAQTGRSCLISFESHELSRIANSQDYSCCCYLGPRGFGCNHCPDPQDRNTSFHPHCSRNLAFIGSFTSSIIFGVFICILVGVTRIIGRLPIESKLPLAELCSLVISAACHPAPDVVDPHLAKVQWGLIDGMLVEGRMHCSLSSRPIREPEVAKIYM
jgi:hypothetical protein